MWNASFKLTLFGCVISICCVGFASLDVVCDELNDCVWNGGAIWLNPFATVLFSVCSAVTIECCVFVPVLHGCVWYVCCYVRKKALLQCLSNY